MKNHIPLAVHLAMIVCLAPVTIAAFQAGPAPVPAPADVPEALLNGDPNFNLALLIQADLRGNYGPCG
jgi:hypothetical protein